MPDDKTEQQAGDPRVDKMRVRIKAATQLPGDDVIYLPGDVMETTRSQGEAYIRSGSAEAVEASTKVTEPRERAAQPKKR